MIIKKGQYFLYYSSPIGVISYLYLEKQNKWMTLSLRSEVDYSFSLIEQRSRIGLRLLNRYSDIYDKKIASVLMYFIANYRLYDTLINLKKYAPLIQKFNIDDVILFFEHPEHDVDEIDILT